MLEKYITSTGQTVLVHTEDKCKGGSCCIHNPSDHHMVDWPMVWRQDRMMMERMCEHGVGHPDPDALEFSGQSGVHGCDGCCMKEETDE
jgi:hypothetical protein